MPYIAPEGRPPYEEALETLCRLLAYSDAGDFNYVVSRLADRWAMRSGEFRYQQSVRDIIGELECVKLEWYARRARPYEDVKRLLNGDTYPSTTEALGPDA